MLLEVVGTQAFFVLSVVTEIPGGTLVIGDTKLSQCTKSHGPCLKFDGTPFPEGKLALNRLAALY